MDEMFASIKVCLPYVFLNKNFVLLVKREGGGEGVKMLDHLKKIRGAGQSLALPLMRH